jgi:hypothetical protein
VFHTRFSARLGLSAAALLAIATLASAVAPAAAQAHTRTYGNTTLTLDPGAAAALQSLGVTPGVIAPATANPDASLSFPITDSLGQALATGTITHSGGISLTAGATAVDLTNFNINLFHQTLTADVGGSRVPILTLDLSDAHIGFSDGALTFGPVTASLTETAANALNSAFHVSAFTEGLVLGTATIHYHRFTWWS